MSKTDNLFYDVWPGLKAELPSEEHELIIAGDVSGTNTALSVYTVNSELDLIKQIYWAKANTKTIDGNFNIALDDFLELVDLQKDDISRMVLGVAGPVKDEGSRVQLTNGPQVYELQANSFGIETALINDFAANGFAIAAAGEKKIDLDFIQLKHLDGKYYEPEPHGQIGIFGPGTGCGVGALKYSSANVYEPFESEMGHIRLAADKKLINWLKKQPDLKGKIGDHPHIESIMSGPGIQRLFNYFRGWNRNKETRDFDRLVKMNDGPNFVASYAKLNDNSISKKAMDYFWTQYGLALYDVAAVTKSTGGLWIAGGVIRNNIEKVRNQPEIIDEHIEKLLMEGIDRAGTQNHLISKMPVYAITDGYLGIKGAMAAAAIPKYNKQLKFYK